MRKIDLSELRAIQLDILSEVDEFCKKNGIRYSLWAGTLLGAVRHKGFIPWDDDIDLMMPRDGYDRFAREFRSEKSVLQDLRNDPNVIECFLKVYRKNTRMIDTQFGRNLWGIYIDIFPIDGVPDSYREQCNRIIKLKEQLPRVCPFYKTVPHNKALWFAKYVIKRIAFPFYGSVLDIKKKIETIAKSTPFETSSYAGVILGELGDREVVKKSVFDTYVDMPFEGKMFPAIKEFDIYLRALYGDYMKLPPVEQRVSHHPYDSYVDD